MDTSAIKRVNAQITKRVNARLTEDADLDARAVKEETAIEAAMEKMDKATEAGDADAYRKAKLEKKSHADALEMLQARRLAVKQIFSEEEAQEMAEAVLGCVEAYEDARSKKLRDLAEEMYAVYEELQDVSTEANAAIRRIEKMAPGLAIRRVRDHSIVEYNPMAQGAGPDQARQLIGELKMWARVAADHHQYFRATGHKIDQPEKRKTWI